MVNDDFAEVAIEGDYALVGAPADDGADSDTGLVLAFAGLLGSDCDCDGMVDACATLSGAALDTNDNLVPDVCEENFSVFIGPADGAWSEPVFWSTGLVPDASTIAFIDTCVDIDEAATADTLVLASNAEVTVALDATLTVQQLIVEPTATFAVVLDNDAPAAARVSVAAEADLKGTLRIFPGVPGTCERYEIIEAAAFAGALGGLESADTPVDVSPTVLQEATGIAVEFTTAPTLCDYPRMLPQDPSLWYAWSVATSGSSAAVSAHLDFENGTNAGAAYTYDYNGVDWIDGQKLLASDGNDFDFFGIGLSMSDNTLVIGAPGDVGETGAAYVFQRIGGVWVEQQKLVPNGGGPGDSFGVATAVSGDFIMIGAWGDDDGATDAGAVYVYRFDGAQWAFEDKLIRFAGYGNLGGAIAIDGDVAVVGAAGNNFEPPPFEVSGSIHVYQYDGRAWTLTAVRSPSDSAPTDYFGHSVDVVGTRFLVGAPLHDNANGENAGAAYLLEFDGETWVEDRWIEAGEFAWFGWAVSLDEQHAVVTAPSDSPGGSAYAYRFNGVSWEVAREFTATTKPGAQFGYSVSLDEDNVLVGARNEGAAYAFAGAAGHDCDCDMLTDGCAIAFGLSSDTNADFLPDDCQQCPGDITGPDGVPDGAVDALDFLALIAQWGTPCADPCTADITGPLAEPDGNVDALDFLLLIAQWGGPANC
jgi:hypothetical protein